jgi:hypothetical protein
MNNIIQFYTYPDGPADQMGQDEIVLVRDSLGSLNNTYVGDLIKGDYYCKRIPSPLPPRSADDILEYMAKNGIQINYISDDETHDIVLVEAVKGQLVLCQMAFNDARTAIRDVIEPIMDMEEL